MHTAKKYSLCCALSVLLSVAVCCTGCEQADVTEDPSASELDLAGREPGEGDGPVFFRQALSPDDVNFDEYDVVIKDNENYFYCMNRKKPDDGRYYTGKVYYKRSGTYNYRGEGDMVRRESCFSILYIDCRYDKKCLTTCLGNDSGSYRATVYFEPTQHVWGLSLEIYAGAL